MSMLVCPNCQYYTENEERFCCHCGTELVAVREKTYCSSCGAQLKPYADYCTQCGAKRNPAGNAVCAGCGAELKAGELYCGRCGTKAGARSEEITDADLETKYREALDDYENKRYVSAVPKLKAAAGRGHPKAQYYLADCLLNGLGVPMDEKEGTRWMSLAHEQGIDEDTVVEKREELLSEAKRGDAYALYRLARSITRHYSTSKPDYMKDRRRLAKASALGYAPALYLLGSCYHFVANQRKESGIKAKMKEKAFELYCEAAKRGHAGARFAMGECYRAGEGVKRNTREAFRCYCEAEKEGYRDPLSLFTIGLCHETGVGTPKDENEAIRMYRRAVRQGDRFLATEHLRKLELLRPDEEETGPAAQSSD